MMRALQGSKVNKPVKKNNGKGNGNGNRKKNTGAPKGKSGSKVKSKTSAIADTSQGDMDKAGKLDEDTMKEWGPTWRNLGMFGCKLGFVCPTWSCVEAFGAEVGPNVPIKAKKRWK